MVDGGGTTPSCAAAFTYKPHTNNTHPRTHPQMLAWADEVRTLKVKANADTPEDAKKARELGAEGIGLCRTVRVCGGRGDGSVCGWCVCSDV